MSPLEGIVVLDFSTLLPGPLASLFLAEAGAEVIKVERPGEGDAMRASPADFDMLNAGKRSIALDLKAQGAVAALRPLIARCDILVEQFRPGTMERLGLGYEAVRAIRPDIIYCSINGYGSTGPYADTPGHDLTYAAESGLLGLTAGADGAPVVPWALVADVGGGTYPALVNLLLALRRRDRGGGGCRIEIAMFDGLYAFSPWALAESHATGAWPKPNRHAASGGSPRYRLYATADGRHLAVACPEPKFWTNFCALIGLPGDLAASDDWPAASAAVARIVATRSAADWDALFAGKDVCCAVVRTPEEAAAGPLLAARRLLEAPRPGVPPALPLPIAPALRGPQRRPAPGLGEHDALIGGPKPG